MRLLPRLTQGSLAWCLPLADCSASALEAVLLKGTDDEQRDALTTLLADDPALALWTVCQAQAREGTKLTTSAAAADWLAPRLLSLLDSADGEADAQQVEASLRDRYAQLAAGAVVDAHVARHQAQSAGGDVDPDEAAMLALLGAADEWLALAAVEPMPNNQTASCLPDWLAKQIRVDRTDVTASDAKAIERLGQDVVRRWTTDVEGVAWRLPALVAKLGSLYKARLEYEKLESVKELAYGAGHEINNPLANISARAQTLLRDETNPERRRRLAAINSQAFRAHEMIADMMLIARPPKLSPERVDLGDLVDDIADQMAAEAERRGTTIACRRPADPIVVEADPVQLGVALSAICRNALEAIGGGGHVQMEVRCTQDQSGDDSLDAWAEIVVADDGPGITAEARGHLFDPFYSGREAGRGLGFGLSKCWRIVTDHGGQIVVDSGPGRGATFTVRLPRASAAVARRAS